MQQTLSELKIDDMAEIVCLNLCGAIRRRLQDVGFIPGARIQCILKNPCCDLCAYWVRGAAIAIRKCESDRIIVRRM